MTAVNHALTGATIAFVLGNPVLAVPLAFLSHFVCDAIPHYTPNIPDEIWIRSKAFKGLLIADGSFCTLLVALLAIYRPEHWLLASICAFLATSPDLVWLNHFVKSAQNKPWKPSLFSKFAAKIQWYARPLGVTVEIAWAIAGISIVTQFL
jgi:hypothetical protein